MTFVLALLNPNTNPAHTEAMAAVALAALPGGCRVEGCTAERGPESIESDVDAAVSAAEVLEMMRRTPAADAYLIACFGDPGLHGARELTSAPVVGIGEAAYRAAGLVARRFAVITTLRRGIPELEDAMRRDGVADRCVGVLPLHLPVAEQGASNETSIDAIIEAGSIAVDRLGAEALVLACGAMADSALRVGDALGVPACDGVAFGALTAFALRRAGLMTSKTGSYAWPEQIPFAGMDPFRR